VQQELESVQKQISAKGKNATETLYAQQKEILAMVRQQQEAFAAAVTHLTDMQKKEALLAVEVVRLAVDIHGNCLERAVVFVCYSCERCPVRVLMFMKVMITFVLMYLGNTQNTVDRGTTRSDSHGARAAADAGAGTGV